MPYDFIGFLDARDDDPLDDDLLQAWLAGSDLDDETSDWLRHWAHQVAGPLRDAADFVERPENRPRLAGKGPFDNDPQQVVLPAETWEALGAVHGSGIWAPDLDERARMAMVYLLNQNGEAGVTCSVACTDGLRRILRRFPDDERSRTALVSLEDAAPEQWAHGAQFVTEIQGGSDAGANAVRAEGPDEAGRYELHGQKWFCSNLTADWWLVTARPDGAPDGGRGVALFCVPRDQDGYTIERLKDKLGTRALPTAEIRFHGAKGWPVGPLEEGLKNMVSTVLVTSRIHNMLACAGFARRAVQEAEAYAAFRSAFGQPLQEMPLVAASLDRIRGDGDRLRAGVFATVDAWLAAQHEDAEDDARLWARILVSLAKARTARCTPSLVYEAMMVLGGNGIEERFTGLPRLWRDAAILETWEGPYTLLMMQALADLRRFEVAGREEAFLAGGLGDHVPDGATAELEAILVAPEDSDAPVRWEALAQRLYAAWEQQALNRLRH